MQELYTWLWITLKVLLYWSLKHCEDILWCLSNSVLKPAFMSISQLGTARLQIFHAS